MRRTIALLIAAALLAGCSGKKEQKTEKSGAEQQQKQEQQMTQETSMPDISSLTFEQGPEGLEYYVETKGDGAAVQNGQQVTVHYTGWLLNGKKFDSSVDRGQPFKFVIGQGRVIRGWELGVGMMHVGDKWLLKLPPELAYGSRGAGGAIPPNSTLIFEVEVLGTN